MSTRKMLVYSDTRELKQPFVIARETIERVQSIVVELEQDGCKGLGEAALVYPYSSGLWG